MADGIEQAGQSVAEGILNAVKISQQKNEMRAKALLQSGQQRPEILDDPNVLKTVKKYTGDEATARGLIEAARSKSLPGQALTALGTMGVPEEAVRQTVAPGSVPLPAGEPGPVQPAPSQSELGRAALGALPEIATQKGFGVQIGPQGISLRQAPPTRVEVGEMTGLQAWQGIREQLADSGLEPDKVDVLAAKLTVSGMAKTGQIPPKWMRDMALASTTDQIAAAHETAVKSADAAVERQTARGIEAERSAGRVAGEAAGKAAVPFQSMTVTKPDGTKVDIPLEKAEAFASTGVESAISLGKNPSKTQLEEAAISGADLFTGQSGDIIRVPVGQSPKLDVTPAAAVLQGKEALKALDEVKGVVESLNSPDFLKLFPSEAKIGREKARSLGYLKSWIRGLTDPADSLAKRGELRQTGFRLARLLGSNSQLSDAERENAQKVLQPVIDGTATQEQIKAAYKSITGMLTRQDSRRGKPATEEGSTEGGVPRTPEQKSTTTKTATTQPTGTSLGDKQNNPGHVKSTAFTRRLPGYVGDGKAAKDGGKFAIFDSPESGRAAMESVLTRVHGDKRIDTALRMYSGGGYDVKKVAADAGVDPKLHVRDLSPEQRSTLIDAMIHAEGSSTGLSREARASRLAAAVNSGKLKQEDAIAQLRENK